jgi:hypothetical protein
LLFGLALFALTGPHSIAAAHLSLSLSLGAWIVRDLAARRFHFARTPLDWPLLCFAGWTLLSAVFSIEPRESLPKLRSLLLFGVIYIVATNLQARGVRFFVALLMASSLAGVGYSLIEKISGRGMILTAISADSPLASSPLQPGDVIWMIARHRVSSLEDAAPIIRRYGPGARLEIEALHAGDPLPVDLLVTDALKARSNPLGLSVNGRSRRFRVSGFTRHFVTYAEQMQLLTLLVFGWMLAGLKSRRPRRHLWLSACLALFALFSLTLILTASRSAIASCLLTLIAVSIIVGGRRAALISLLAVLALTSFAVYTLRSSRALSAVSFTDDSTERRLGYMRAGLRLIPQHPLLGVGMDAHKRHWTAWGFPGDYVTHTHSTPIQIAMDRGLPALGCYVWLMVAMFVLTWRGYARARQLGDEAGGFRLGAFAMLIGFSASSLVNYNFGDAETLLMLLFVIGLSVADQAFPKNQPDRSDGLGPQATDAPALSGEPASGHQIKFIDAYRHIG